MKWRKKFLPKARRKTPTPPGPEKMMSPAIGGKMSQPKFVPRKMKLLLFPVRSTWLASQEYPDQKLKEHNLACPGVHTILTSLISRLTRMKRRHSMGQGAEKKLE